MKRVLRFCSSPPAAATTRPVRHRRSTATKVGNVLLAGCVTIATGPVTLAAGGSVVTADASAVAAAAGRALEQSGTTDRSAGTNLSSDGSIRQVVGKELGNYGRRLRSGTPPRTAAAGASRGFLGGLFGSRGKKDDSGFVPTPAGTLQGDVGQENWDGVPYHTVARSRSQSRTAAAPVSNAGRSAAATAVRSPVRTTQRSISRQTTGQRTTTTRNIAQDKARNATPAPRQSVARGNRRNNTGMSIPTPPAETTVAKRTTRRGSLTGDATASAPINTSRRTDRSTVTNPAAGKPFEPVSSSRRSGRRVVANAKSTPTKIATGGKPDYSGVEDLVPRVSRRSLAAKSSPKPTAADAASSKPTTQNRSAKPAASPSQRLEKSVASSAASPASSAAGQSTPTDIAAKTTGSVASPSVDPNGRRAPQQRYAAGSVRAGASGAGGIAAKRPTQNTTKPDKQPATNATAQTAAKTTGPSPNDTNPPNRPGAIAARSNQVANPSNTTVASSNPTTSVATPVTSRRDAPGRGALVPTDQFAADPFAGRSSGVRAKTASAAIGTGVASRSVAGLPSMITQPGHVTAAAQSNRPRTASTHRQTPTMSTIATGPIAALPVVTPQSPMSAPARAAAAATSATARPRQSPSVPVAPAVAAPSIAEISAPVSARGSLAAAATASTQAIEDVAAAGGSTEPPVRDSMSRKHWNEVDVPRDASTNEEIIASNRNDGRQVSTPPTTGNVMRRTIPPTSAADSGAAASTGSIASTESPVAPEPTAEVDRPGMTAIRSELPGLRVTTFGPEALTIRQTGEYEIRVENRGSIDAEGVLVRAFIPDWARLQGDSTTAGHVQRQTADSAQRLVWTIDQLPAGKTETLLVRLSAAASGSYQMDVDWTLMPRKAVAKVKIHEPKLDLQIEGPDSIVFGQSESYKVRVINPGDGVAPDVVFILSPGSTPQTQRIGDIPAGKEAQFDVELTAQDLTDLKIHGLATGDLDLRSEAEKRIEVLSANFEAVLTGPQAKYQNAEATYSLELTNHGTADSTDVVAKLILPAGVKYLGGIDGVDDRDRELVWTIPALAIGASKTFEFKCQLASTGRQSFGFEARGTAAGRTDVSIATDVESIADLVLSINDPVAPAPIGGEVVYEILIRNRGSRAAKDVRAVAQFSHGIEPVRIVGQTGQLMTGQVIFDKIDSIAAGEEAKIRVIAIAEHGGRHRFRTEVTSEEIVLVAEEATHFMNRKTERISSRSAPSTTTYR